MTKHEELEHMKYALDMLGSLPADISIGALYTHLKGAMENLKSTITAREQFNHQWYRCTKRILGRPPYGSPCHAQDVP